MDEMEVGYLFSFLAGVLSVASPCVLPLIPIVIGHSLLRRRMSELFIFILGFYLVFAVLSTLTVIFTAAINHYVLHFRVIASITIILLGFMLLVNRNIFNFPIKNKNKKGYVGSFAFGLLTSLAWAPCYGPYIVAVAAFSASTGNWMYSAFNMILFAVGFSMALLVIAILTSKISLEFMVKYSDEIRIVSGIIIIIAGIYLLTGYMGI